MNPCPLSYVGNMNCSSYKFRSGFNFRDWEAWFLYWPGQTVLSVISLAGRRVIVPPKYIDYGVYGDLTTIHPKPYSIYFRGTIAGIKGGRAVHC